MALSQIIKGDTGISLLSQHEFYNALNKRHIYNLIQNPHYIYLLDVRDRNSYNESHIISALHFVKDSNGQLNFLYDARPECKWNIVIYDSNTQDLSETSLAVEAAQFIYKNNSRHNVSVLKGGFETFSRYFPFMRTQQILYLPKEIENIPVYPLDIIHDTLYIGNLEHATSNQIKLEMKMHSIIFCSDEATIKSHKSTDTFLTLALEDNANVDISEILPIACDFINSWRKHKKRTLIASPEDFCRNVTIALAYLAKYEEMTLKEAWNHMKRVVSYVRPNRGFMRQIAEYVGESSFDENDYF